MTYNHSDPTNASNAAKNLANLIGNARTAAENRHLTSESLSALGSAMMPYARISNVAGVHIYQTRSGFFADIELKSTPPGITSLYGTPTSSPLATYEDARDAAIFLLSLTILAENTPAPTPPISAPFIYHGFVFEIPTELLANLSPAPPHFEDYIRNLLTDFDKHLPSPIPEDFIETLTEQDRKTLDMLIINAARCGHVRWPLPIVADHPEARA